MNKLFINASSNPNGNTKCLADKLLSNDHQTINLAEYFVHQYGKEESDDFKGICDQLRKSDILVMETLTYWSSMTEYMKTFIDRMTDTISNNPFYRKDLYLIVTGTSPEDVIPHDEHVWKHLSDQFDMNFRQTITSVRDAGNYYLG